MSHAHTDGPADPSPQPRRGFVKLVTVFLSGVVAGIPFLPGLSVFLDPIRKRDGDSSGDGAAGGEEGMVQVTNIDAVPADGVPRQFPVIQDEHDAWTFVPQQRIGSVFIRRDPETEQLQCFSSICPHAGCSVQYSSDQEAYICPCHNSLFALDGKMIQPTPSPRDLDPLEVKATDSGAVLVKYVRYYAGKEERKEKS